MAITALMLKRLERRLIRLFVSGLGPLNNEISFSGDEIWRLKSLNKTG
jgi:hypothetical protein